MIKIGTLTCLHSNNVCARVGCLNAFQNRSDFFDGYSPDTLLGAMMTCNGCKSIKHNCNLMIKTDFIKADTDGFGFFSIILSIVNCQLSID